jgi:hypothetical protein
MAKTTKKNARSNARKPVTAKTSKTSKKTVASTKKPIAKRSAAVKNEPKFTQLRTYKPGAKIRLLNLDGTKAGPIKTIASAKAANEHIRPKPLKDWLLIKEDDLFRHVYEIVVA